MVRLLFTWYFAPINPVCPHNSCERESVLSPLDRWGNWSTSVKQFIRGILATSQVQAARLQSPCSVRCTTWLPRSMYAESQSGFFHTDQPITMSESVKRLPVGLQERRNHHGLSKSMFPFWIFNERWDTKWLVLVEWLILHMCLCACACVCAHACVCVCVCTSLK